MELRRCLPQFHCGIAAGKGSIAGAQGVSPPIVVGVRLGLDCEGREFLPGTSLSTRGFLSCLCSKSPTCPDLCQVRQLLNDPAPLLAWVWQTAARSKPFGEPGLGLAPHGLAKAFCHGADGSAGSCDRL